jgi:hypothetical protein
MHYTQVIFLDSLWNKNVEAKFHAFSALTLNGNDWLPLLEERHICQ